MLGISSCATRYRDLEQDDWSATWVDLRMSHARPAGVVEPTQRTNPAERNSRVRPFHLIAIFAAVVATQLVSVVPARAAVDDLACSYDHVSYNACLDFEDVGEPGKLDAHVGLDSFMSEYAARDLIAHGGDFRASLWADDDHDQFIADLTLEPGWPTAGAGGLGVAFDGAGLSRSVLNEDADGEDEIYAKISYFDHRRGKRVLFSTGVVRAEFTYRHPGGGHPVCLSFC